MELVDLGPFRNLSRVERSSGQSRIGSVGVILEENRAREEKMGKGGGMRQCDLAADTQRCRCVCGAYCDTPRGPRARRRKDSYLDENMV